ncbi:MAG TPA: Holliday junction branch migration protein RuvA [Saprospiraceae bacterium]|nr:Holliday junction branch migration protein RuvA [Saprospiraceae bacterium]HMQ83831.1 Holliday junction branch migration protein RuvA [Saprospiraceae bacterium]
MIAYIKGEINFKSPTYVVVETGGVGYHINISLHTYGQIEKLESVKILTHLHIKEDSHTLYGFADAVERNLFRHLISVSGIGPATAQVLLSAMNPDELRAAIIAEDLNAFKHAKGIGPKTAKRIILDLKDKMLKDSSEPAPTLLPQDNTIREEALSGLVALGFNRIAVQKALNKIIKEQGVVANVETLIKLALKELG